MYRERYCGECIPRGLLVARSCTKFQDAHTSASTMLMVPQNCCAHRSSLLRCKSSAQHTRVSAEQIMHSTVIACSASPPLDAKLAITHTHTHTPFCLNHRDNCGLAHTAGSATSTVNHMRQLIMPPCICKRNRKTDRCIPLFVLRWFELNLKCFANLAVVTMDAS